MICTLRAFILNQIIRSGLSSLYQNNQHTTWITPLFFIPLVLIIRLHLLLSLWWRNQQKNITKDKFKKYSLFFHSWVDWLELLWQPYLLWIHILPLPLNLRYLYRYSRIKRNSILIRFSKKIKNHLALSIFSSSWSIRYTHL